MPRPHNCCVLSCHCAGSGKTATLEGRAGRETWGTSEGDGLVHLAVDELFGLVHGKAITVGGCNAEQGLMSFCHVHLRQSQARHRGKPLPFHATGSEGATLAMAWTFG